MPRGDRTGPAGLGPMTGNQKGLCSGSTVPGFMNRGWAGGGGWGRGAGCGRGAGWGRGAGGGRRFRGAFSVGGVPRLQAQMVWKEQHAASSAGRPALVRKVAVVDKERCNDCGVCIDSCAWQAISMNGTATIDPKKCTGCAACIRECPSHAISLSAVRPSSAERER